MSGNMIIPPAEFFFLKIVLGIQYFVFLYRILAQMVKNLPAMQETQIQFLGWEDPLEKETATHSSFLAWEIPWTEEPGGLQSMGSQESGTT